MSETNYKQNLSLEWSELQKKLFKRLNKENSIKLLLYNLVVFIDNIVFSPNTTTPSRMCKLTAISYNQLYNQLSQNAIAFFQEIRTQDLYNHLYNLEQIGGLNGQRYFDERISTDAFSLHNRFRQRQQVVIAYGLAHFYHAMRGNRSVPVEKFKRIVYKYLTVVPTSEIRTSKECSHLYCINDQDFLNNPWQDLRSIHSEAHPDGARGGTLYKIKICTIDNTIWDRDVNAARNILYVFYSENTNQQRPINFNPRRAAA
ncbi:hypothetical protein BDC45DRAFT_558755 [Circinella umbellata]|nr:hypothetical protein BDC45DRAFT_558755 [Circinella umbellata]